MKLIKLAHFFLILQILTPSLFAQGEIEDHGMRIHWSYQRDSIIFTIHTPTLGWQAIGFNESSGLTDTYLIMGRVSSQKAEVNEHYVFAPGKYQSISELGQSQRAIIMSSSQDNNSTTIKFSLPSLAHSKYQRTLQKGQEVTIHYAYSTSIDFDHHSIFRTSTKIIL